MKNLIKKTVFSLMSIRAEEEKILNFISSLQLTPEQKLLDIGCGYCSKLKLIKSLGINAIGVDVNLNLVEQNRKAGLNCLTVDEFKLTKDSYDVLLMSHVIEHFPPAQLLEFMDSYLDRLKPEGYLIIATPLNSPYFYDDFDHIKPYHPVGINMVFGGTKLQVQYYAKNCLQLQKLWFRREPFRLTFFASLYLKKYSLPFIINILFALLFRLSCGIVGTVNGWVGLYQKVAQ